MIDSAPTAASTAAPTPLAYGEEFKSLNPVRLTETEFDMFP